MKKKIQKELKEAQKELKTHGSTKTIEQGLENMDSLSFDYGYMRGLEIAVDLCDDIDDLTERKAKAYDAIKERYADYNPDYKIIYK